ncbi:MAG: hypothetical protein O7D96_09475 [SAR324 cluster bacterium]|nr:hypothetical protein [SAR324 cluster bacterium]
MHRFNGFTDQFSTIKGGRLTRGLRDAFLRISGAEGVKWRAEYHGFRQETQSQEYGTEVALAEHLTGLISVADYRAGGGNDSGIADKDEQGFWARLDYSF